jgi:hypothetical protein
MPTEMAFETNPIGFTVQKEGGIFNSFGTMSMLKQTEGEKSTYWWGYSQQLNIAKPTSELGSVNILQWMSTLNQDIRN